MTIIKISKDGKILKKKEEEVAVPLTPPDVDLDGHVMPVDVVMSTRSKRLVNTFLLLIALLVLSAGIIGGVYLYRYMAHRHKVSHVAVEYWCGTDELYQQEKNPERMPTPLPQGDQPHNNANGRLFVMEEDIDIQMENDLERIEVPQFDECQKSVIIHNFQKNLTVIVDNDDGECFIMELDRAHMSPPKTFADLIQKHASGYYMPKVDVVRRQFQVMTPAITDMTFAGRAIELECLGYDSYMLIKKEDLQPKEQVVFRVYFKTYGYSDLKAVIKDMIYK